MEPRDTYAAPIWTLATVGALGAIGQGMVAAKRLPQISADIRRFGITLVHMVLCDIPAILILVWFNLHYIGFYA